MIVAVTVCYDDREPCIEYVDTEKLDPTDYVDGAFLKAVKKNGDWCSIDAENWDQQPDKFPTDDIGLGGQIKKPKKIDRAMILQISFG